MQTGLERTTRTRRRPRFSLARREAVWAYIFLAVPLLFFLGFRIWPAFQSFYLSLFSWHVDAAQREFLGVAQYRQMLADPKLHRALLNTLLYTAIIVPAQLALGLGIASLLNSVDKFQPALSGDLFCALRHARSGGGLGVGLDVLGELRRD